MATIEIDLQPIINRLDIVRRVQSSYASGRALNQLGYGLRGHHQEWMRRNFESTVPFTIASPRYQQLSDKELKFYISKDGAKGQDPARYLFPQSFEAGSINSVYVTRFARGIKKEGITDLFPVPSFLSPLVSKTSGRMTPGKYQSVLAALKRKDPQYFSIPDRRAKREGKHLPSGIYKRKGLRGAQMLFKYLDQVPAVKAKYDFVGITDRYIEDNWPRLFQEALDRAI